MSRVREVAFKSLVSAGLDNILTRAREIAAEHDDEGQLATAHGLTSVIHALVEKNAELELRIITMEALLSI
jgi:hypothetical protein